MWRDGVVDIGLHPVGFQIFLQLVPLFAHKRKDMEHAVLPKVVGRQADQSVLYIVNVEAGVAASPLVLLVKERQLSQQHRSL